MWCTDVAYICTCWAWARIKDVCSSTMFKEKGVLKPCGAQMWHTSAPVVREHVSRTKVHLLCSRKRRVLKPCGAQTWHTSAPAVREHKQSTMMSKRVVCLIWWVPDAMRCTDLAYVVSHMHTQKYAHTKGQKVCRCIQAGHAPSIWGLCLRREVLQDLFDKLCLRSFVQEEKCFKLATHRQSLYLSGTACRNSNVGFIAPSLHLRRTLFLASLHLLKHTVAGLLHL